MAAPSLLPLQNVAFVFEAVSDYVSQLACNSQYDSGRPSICDDYLVASFCVMGLQLTPIQSSVFFSSAKLIVLISSLLFLVFLSFC